MFIDEHPSSTYGLLIYLTIMTLSLDISQVPGASCTVMDTKYVMLMSTEGASATDHVQCTWSYGEGVSNMRWRLQGQPVTAFRHAICSKAYLM
jgi:hypothetical protein